MNPMLTRLSSHVSSFAMAGLLLAYYLAGDGSALDEFLPINGKPLAIFLLLAVVILFELVTSGYKRLNDQLADLSRQMEINAVKGAIAGLYRMYLSTGSEFIRDEAIIRELHATRDNMTRLGINSYSEQKVEFLLSKIDLARPHV